MSQDPQDPQQQQQPQTRERRPSVGTGDAAGGQSDEGIQQAMCFSADLMAYLAILNYEENFCNRQNVEPITQYYFALPGQPSVQFNHFQTLCGWLFSQIGHQPTWARDDDPTTVANEIMIALRQAIGEVDFPSSKLRTGFGEAVCCALAKLSEKAASKIQMSQPHFADEAVGEEIYGQDGGDEDEVVDEVEEDEISEEEPMFQVKETKDAGDDAQGADPLAAAIGPEDDHAVGQPKFDKSTIDPQQWALELERVGPQLRIDNDAVTRDLWRSHIDKLENTLRDQGDFESVKFGLRGCHGELSEILSKIKMAENRVGQFKGAKKIKEDRSEVMKLAQQIESLQDEVDDRQEELSKINERKEQLQNNLDDRTKDASDTGPLQKIKETMDQLKFEIRQMDLRIGVVMHTLMQAQAQHHAKARGGRNGPMPANPNVDDFMAN